jgi:formylglycine-generating enzyme required for sulfatase activity
LFLCVVALGHAVLAQTHAARLNEEMVLVHGGSIEVGIDAAEIPHFEDVFGVRVTELYQDEVPRHTVTLADFYLDRNLVTNAQFRRFTELNPEWRPGKLAAELDNGNYIKHWSTPTLAIAQDDHPVVNVNWYAATAYCRWAGKRLPSEAEWEYASRGGGDTLFPWGDETPDATRANYAGSHLGTTTAVGSYPPNPFGLFDMAGNVWQFLADEWQKYPSGPQKNLVAGGPVRGDADGFLRVKTRRVIRGGSYDGEPLNMWVEYRDSHPPNGSRDFVGFRCAK